VLIRHKLQYASVAWNSITAADASKLERIQRMFVAVCHRRFSIIMNTTMLMS